MAPASKKGSSSKKNGGGLKQGTLFSFFSKKKTTATKPTATTKAATTNISSKPSSSAPPAISQATASSPSQPSSPLDQVTLGCFIEIFWKNDNAWYRAKVTQQRGGSNDYFLEYDDGSDEWIDLSRETFRFPVNKRQNKRIRDDTDDDEEQEFELDDDDESEFEENDNELSAVEEEDDNWMVTDDEDDVKMAKRKSASTAKQQPSKSKKKQKVRQQPHQPTVTPKSTKSLSQFAASFTVTEHAQPAASKSNTPTAPSRPKSITPMTSSLSASQPKTVAGNKSTVDNKPPPFVDKAVNIAGSHVHNHLKFLQYPKDALGRPRDHPDYDPRTLYINENDWIKVTGKKMTDAVKQWWDLKKQYYDTVLLFKTGKFYEMFHMDADIGVTVCDFKYMKGVTAHAGFPEISYGIMADKLVRAGYKVARVEQTETPEQLKVRKKKARKGNVPKVVNREVCSILTLGTRTFCYLDDSEKIVQDPLGETSPMGPLLAIREIVLEPTSATTEDGDVQPVCEYGVTLVDAVRGWVTVGQFADDVLRSRMTTLLTTFCPSEILVEGTDSGASPTLLSLIRSFQSTSLQNTSLEIVKPLESFPASTAIDADIRRQLERGKSVHPWDVQETLEELHRRKYFPKASKKEDDRSIERWPQVLRAVIEGGAELALSSFGAVLFYLQRSLIDFEVLSMGQVKAYVPPESSTASQSQEDAVRNIVSQDMGIELPQGSHSPSLSRPSSATPALPLEQISSIDPENQVAHMTLDGTTLHNLEILTNLVDHKTSGSLWSKINHTKSPHGAKLLRAWLLRPLFRKAEIERRADAVQDLVSGGGAVALAQARKILSKCGDIDRLLSRVHSMSERGSSDDDEDSGGIHPQSRQVLFEGPIYTKRKVNDFSKLLNGLRAAAEIPEVFKGIELQSGFLSKVVRYTHEGGCFPDMAEDLEWYFDNFDCDQAAKGEFEPARGVDERYDQATERIKQIISQLNHYKDEMCNNHLSPRSRAKSSWKYANVKPGSKDKYLIELDQSVAVPDDFQWKGKRGSGAKQVNKYRTPYVERLVAELEQAYDIQAERRAQGIKLIFARFDASRKVWQAVSKATSILDALGSLAQTASKPGFTRPVILECLPNESPRINIVQGRHPCVETTYSSSDFIPNDLALGSPNETGAAPRVLLLSGPNMGGKSTLLRQTCLITILAQIGSYVPAELAEVTPVDRIFTRLGASDRILLKQSTFFVELAETAAALRGATRRSLVIMDELGRGTSTFDGTAIASATVEHLVQRNQCIALFATHYHSLLEEWKNNPEVSLGHMEVVVEERNDGQDDTNITFLYTLGPGICPKSFGINVARLADLPLDVISTAKRISAEFEDEMNDRGGNNQLSDNQQTASAFLDAVSSGSFETARDILVFLK